MFFDAPLDSGTATVEAGCCARFGSDGHGGLTEDLPTERFVAGRTTYTFVQDFQFNIFKSFNAFDPSCFFLRARTFHVHSEGLLPECSNQALDLRH